ncbi:MAG: DNA-binding protein YbiB [Serpentinimonas sp.]|nr:DNA-binding protein YbiB [Serpentinimonas sp.]
MSIKEHLKKIGRGKDGARSLSRAQAADLYGQVLDGAVSDLEIGAFCIAMRFKGETAEEMAGFLDALEPRLQRWPAPAHSPLPTVVLPSYNGARKLPVLTPLLAALLARAGLAVLWHGCATEDARTHPEAILPALESAGLLSPELQPGRVCWVPTQRLHPGLQRLLDVRRSVGLRNSAHSLVKLMNPVAGPALLLSSYTHSEYLHSMSATLALTGANALLLRGTEGEPVADARRCPAMDAFVAGRSWRIQEAPAGPLIAPDDWPTPDADATRLWTEAALRGQRAIPEPIATQVRHTLELARLIAAAPTPALSHRSAP